MADSLDPTMRECGTHQQADLDGIVGVPGQAGAVRQLLVDVRMAVQQIRHPGHDRAHARMVLQSQVSWFVIV